MSSSQPQLPKLVNIINQPFANLWSNFLSSSTLNTHDKHCFKVDVLPTAPSINNNNKNNVQAARTINKRVKRSFEVDLHKAAFTIFLALLRSPLEIPSTGILVEMGVKVEWFASASSQGMYESLMIEEKKSVRLAIWNVLMEKWSIFRTDNQHTSNNFNQQQPNVKGDNPQRKNSMFALSESAIQQQRQQQNIVLSIRDSKVAAISSNNNNNSVIYRQSEKLAEQQNNVSMMKMMNVNSFSSPTSNLDSSALRPRSELPPLYSPSPNQMQNSKNQLQTTKIQFQKNCEAVTNDDAANDESTTKTNGKCKNQEKEKKKKKKKNKKDTREHDDDDDDGKKKEKKKCKDKHREARKLLLDNLSGDQLMYYANQEGLPIIVATSSKQQQQDRLNAEAAVVATMTSENHFLELKNDLVDVIIDYFLEQFAEQDMDDNDNKKKNSASAKSNNKNKSRTEKEQHQDQLVNSSQITIISSSDDDENENEDEDKVLEKEKHTRDEIDDCSFDLDKFDGTSESMMNMFSLSQQQEINVTSSGPVRDPVAFVLDKALNLITTIPRLSSSSSSSKQTSQKENQRNQIHCLFTIPQFVSQDSATSGNSRRNNNDFISLSQQHAAAVSSSARRRQRSPEKMNDRNDQSQELKQQNSSQDHNLQSRSRNDLLTNNSNNVMKAAPKIRVNIADYIMKQNSNTNHQQQNHLRDPERECNFTSVPVSSNSAASLSSPENTKVILGIDIRERTNLDQASEFFTRNGVPFEALTVPVSDYIFFFRESGRRSNSSSGNNENNNNDDLFVIPLLIERKAADDLEHSLIDKRYEIQRWFMRRAVAMRRIFLIEGQNQTAGATNAPGSSNGTSYKARFQFYGRGAGRGGRGGGNFFNGGGGGGFYSHQQKIAEHKQRMEIAALSASFSTALAHCDDCADPERDKTFRVAMTRTFQDSMCFILAVRNQLNELLKNCNTAQDAEKVLKRTFFARRPARRFGGEADDGDVLDDADADDRDGDEQILFPQEKWLVAHQEFRSCVEKNNAFPRMLGALRGLPPTIGASIASSYGSPLGLFEAFRDEQSKIHEKVRREQEGDYDDDDHDDQEEDTSENVTSEDDDASETSSEESNDDVMDFLDRLDNVMKTKGTKQNKKRTQKKQKDRKKKAKKKVATKKKKKINNILDKYGPERILFDLVREGRTMQKSLSAAMLLKSKSGTNPQQQQSKNDDTFEVINCDDDDDSMQEMASMMIDVKHKNNKTAPNSKNASFSSFVSPIVQAPSEPSFNQVNFASVEINNRKRKNVKPTAAQAGLCLSLCKIFTLDRY